MITRIALSLIILYSAQALPMVPFGIFNGHFDGHTWNGIASYINTVNDKIDQKAVEIKNLRSELDETKKLLKETQAQAQNSVSSQQKSEVIDAITTFTKHTQSLMAESAKQNIALQSEVAQLLEARKRIESMLTLFEASKTTGWEIAFIQTLKTELRK